MAGVSYVLSGMQVRGRLADEKQVQGLRSFQVGKFDPAGRISPGAGKRGLGVGVGDGDLVLRGHTEGLGGLGEELSGLGEALSVDD
jgi:hypothetical protein